MILNSMTLAISMVSYSSVIIGICRFAVYFAFAYFTLSHFVINFAACLRQILGDMTCAFLSFSNITPLPLV